VLFRSILLGDRRDELRQRWTARRCSKRIRSGTRRLGTIGDLRRRATPDVDRPPGGERDQSDQNDVEDAESLHGGVTKLLVPSGSSGTGGRSSSSRGAAGRCPSCAGGGGGGGPAGAASLSVAGAASASPFAPSAPLPAARL